MRPWVWTENALDGIGVLGGEVFRECRPIRTERVIVASRLCALQLRTTPVDPESASNINLGPYYKLLARFTLMIAPVSSWRLTELTLECSIERRFGFVSDIGGDVRDTTRGLFERSGGDLKSPACQIRHGRLVEISSESFDQGGA